MPFKLLGKYGAVALLLTLLTSSLCAQPPFGGGRGGKFGKFGGGGPRGGPGGRFGDHERIFGFLSRGRGYILISESRKMQGPLTEFAKQQGITDGKINKEQFINFTKFLQKKIESGGSPFKGKGGPPGSTGSSNSSDKDDKDSQSSSPEEKLKRYAGYYFKKMDDNDDGQLNKDEVGRSKIREDFKKYDKDGNGLINKDEYLGYYRDRYGERFGVKASSGDFVRILLEEELYKRPTVYRLGKMPDELDWFTKMDTHVKDGQVELIEWRNAQKPLEEFLKMDRNDDGFLTAEEALFFKNVAQKEEGGFSEFYQYGSLGSYPSLNLTPSPGESDGTYGFDEFDYGSFP